VSLIASIISKMPVTNNPIREMIISIPVPGQCCTLNKKAIIVKHIAILPEMPDDFSIPVDNDLVPINKYVIKKTTTAKLPIDRIIPAPGQCNVLKMVPIKSTTIEIIPKVLLIFFMALDLG